MTRSRIALFRPGLVLLGVLGALGILGTGIYLYQNLPDLLRWQAGRVLRHYGVEHIEYEGLRVSHTDASVDALLLRGTLGNVAYEASVSGGALHYNWHTLLSGKVHDLTLSSLDIAFADTPTRSKPDAATAINIEEYLPPQLLAQLPLQSLRIDTWQASYRAPDNRTITAHGSLHIDRRIDLRLQASLAHCAVAGQLAADTRSPELLLKLSVRDAEESVATLAALLARSARPGWEWQVQGQAQHAPLLACLRALENEYSLTLGIGAASDLSLDGKSVVTARIEHPDTLSLVSTPDVDDAPLRQLQASVHLTSTILRLAIPTLIDNVEGALTLDATLADAQINAVLQPFSLAGNLATQRLLLPEHWQRRNDWKETVPLHLETAEPVAITSADNGGWSLQSPSTLLSLGDRDTHLRVEKLNLAAALSDLAAPRAKMKIDALLSPRIDKQALPQLQLAFTQSGTWEQSDFTLHIADATASFRVDLAGALNPTLGSGNYTLHAKIDDLPYFTATASPLLQHFELLETDVAMRSGRIALTSSLASTGFALQEWTQQSQLSAQQLSGIVSGYAFDDLELTAEWSGITRWKTLQPLQISIASVDAGVALQDIKLQVSLPKSTLIAQPKLRIDALSAQVFGGELALPGAQAWDFATASNSATLVASDWQLRELVALQKNADIEAQGALEGQLPITIAGGRAIIDGGYLRALPPGGHIRYRANDDTRALADNNSELALALDLLSDFQYQLLNSEVQLDKAGNLLLALSLEGSNPALYAGQSIRFNINVEQNLDPLLQSLRIGDNLEQRIEDGMK
jgi:hypothetical protein